MDQTLAGKVALVTGAGRGLGRAYALQLGRLGADVAVLDRNLHSFEEYEAEAAQMTAGSTVEEVQALGRRSIGLEVDVTDAAAVQAAVDRVVAELGRLDIVVCNAGGGSGTPFTTRAGSLDLAEFDTVVQRNLYGTVNTCVAAGPIMKAQGSGKIITVASVAGLRANEGGGYAHYGAAKAGVVMYTRYLAQDLGRSGVNVNCIAPGSIGTGRLSVMFQSMGMDRMAAGIALRRVGTPEDCAKVVGFLAGPDSDYVNGAVIPIDGGVLR